MLHKHEPIAEKEMLKRSPDYSICEVLRTVHNTVPDQEARRLIRVAVRMAKRMDMRLQTLTSGWSGNWYDGFWDKTKDIEGDISANL